MSTARFTLILTFIAILLGAPLTILTLHTTSGFDRIESSFDRIENSINRLEDKVERLDDRVDQLAKDVAEIKGALKAKGIMAKR